MNHVKAAAQIKEAKDAVWSGLTSLTLMLASAGLGCSILEMISPIKLESNSPPPWSELFERMFDLYSKTPVHTHPSAAAITCTAALLAIWIGDRRKIKAQRK